MNINNKDAVLVAKQETVIEISSEDESDFSTERGIHTPVVNGEQCPLVNSQKMEQISGVNSTQMEQFHSSSPVVCDNCTQKFEDLIHLQTHLLLEQACFFPLTERYWSKALDERKTCKVCGDVFHDILRLKRHSFNNIKCKLEYFKLYSRELFSRYKSLSAACSAAISHSPSIPMLSPQPNVYNNFSPVTAVVDKSQRLLNNYDPAGHTQSDIAVHTQSATAIHTQSNSSVLAVVNEELARDSLANSLPSLDKQIFMPALARSQNKKVKKASAKYKRRISFNCTVCGKKLKSLRDRNKHLVASVKCRSVIKAPVTSISCLYCRESFTSEGEKSDHLVRSLTCQTYMKEQFRDSKIAQMCNRNGQNGQPYRSMVCCFCHVVVDDVGVFDHILHTPECRQQFEKTLFSHLQAPSNSKKTKELSQKFPCSVCGKTFSDKRYLKAHITKLKHKQNEISPTSGSKEGTVAFSESGTRPPINTSFKNTVPDRSCRISDNSVPNSEMLA